MFRLRFIICAIAMVCSSWVVVGDAPSQQAVSVEAGDRGHEINMIYPDAAFIHNGGPMIDITKAPYLAKGSGHPADAGHNTKAFIAVYDFIMAQLDKYGDMNDAVVQPRSTDCSYIIYIPDGVYYVNDTLIYSGPIRKVVGSAREYCVWLRFIGQSREKTVIQLVDNCDGFGDKANPKPILSFGKKIDVNPMKANNALKNLTISAGAGNPGASAIRWTSANNGEANELWLTSSDGEGFVGFDFSMGGTCGHFRDIIVEGFDYGIRVGTHARHFYNPSLEYVTLRHQKQAGMLCESGSGTFRKFRSENSVPALKITDAYTHAVVLDSAFIGGNSANAALDIVDEGHGLGHVFARNVQVDGYGAGIKKNGATARAGSIKEYVSDPILKFSPDQPGVSMNLPIEELPCVPWEQNLSKWVTAGDGSADDSAAIQAAMNDTKNSVFYFPKRNYRIKRIDVPPHIKVIDFMFSRVSGSPAFLVRQASPDPILFRNLAKSGNQSQVFIEHTGDRVVYTELVGGRYGNPGTTPGLKAFLCSSDISRGDQNYRIKNATVFWRWGNDEYRDGLFEIGTGCRIVILGYKTEGGGVGFDIGQDSKVEILGGVHTNHGRPGWYTADYPYLRIDNAEVSVITRFMQSDKTYINYVQDSRGGKTRKIASGEFVDMGTGAKPAAQRVRSGKVFPEFETDVSQERLIPLYVSYHGTAAQPEK